MGSKQLQLIEEIKNRLSILNPDRIILFGSHAQGSVGADSDIDLIVLNKEEAAALDVLVYSKKEWQALVESQSSFSRDILEKGITLQ